MNHQLRVKSHLAAVWLRQLGVMAVKELQQLGRDRPLLIFVLYIFTMNILMAAGEGTDLNRAPVVVHDADHSAASRELIYRLRPFHFAGEVTRADEGVRLLEKGKARMLLDIPERFERDLQGGSRPAAVQLLVDTSKANIGYLASSYGAGIAAGFSRDWTAQHGARTGASGLSLPVIESRSRILYNPALNEAWFATLSELLTVLTIACILLPASALVREKERGTIEQLLVSPLTPFQIMLSKVLAMILVTLAGTAISLFGIILPFVGFPVKGSLVLFFAVTALYAFTNAGLGLAAATFARNSGQVGMLVLLMVMPIIVLSGTWTPLESMPPWLRMLIDLSPLRHFIEVAYGILLRGAGLGVLWDSVLAMAALGCGLFALGTWRFRRQFR